MKRFFQIIKKKKHLRLLSVMWVFLVMIEMLCPIFCAEPAFAAQQNSPASIVQSLSENEKAAATSDYHSSHDHKACSDECLCQGTAIVGIGFSTPEKTFFRSERIAFLTSNPYTNSLSPPHQPPKIS